MAISTIIAHERLYWFQKNVFEKCNLKISEIEKEKESQAYAAYNFVIKNIAICYREAKTTPTKAGQFVTLWKRNTAGNTRPYYLGDPTDLFMISVNYQDKTGVFIFPKSVLYNKGIIGDDIQGGKRAIRVYAPWNINLNKQALITQKWQQPYFLETSEEATLNLELAEQLLSIEV